MGNKREFSVNTISQTVKDIKSKYLNIEKGSDLCIRGTPVSGVRQTNYYTTKDVIYILIYEQLTRLLIVLLNHFSVI